MSRKDTPVDFGDTTKAELLELAAARELAGRSAMSKQQLFTALKKTAKN